MQLPAREEPTAWQMRAECARRFRLGGFGRRQFADDQSPFFGVAKRVCASAAAATASSESDLADLIFLRVALVRG